MRKGYSRQRLLDNVPIDQVELNPDYRDSIIPVLRALQHVYRDSALMQRDQCNFQVAVEETKVVQERFGNRVKRLSFDRGFHSSEKPETTV